MKISKNTFKIIFIIFIVGILVSGVSVYATYKYLAKDVSYTKENGEEINVEEALNELYSANASDIEYQTFNSDLVYTSSEGTFYTKTISIPEGKRKVYICHSVSSDYNELGCTINSNIIEKQSTIKFSRYSITTKITNGGYFSIIETNGKGGNITITYSCGGFGNHFVSGVVYYK